MNTLAVPKFNLQNLLIGVFMLVAAGLAFELTPKAKLADQRPKVDLEAMIPKHFGDWHVNENIVPLQVSPDVQAKLDKLYNQTLSRTYVNAKGQRVMLSIAYGGDQSDSMQIHKPEVCYPAQGFQIINRVLEDKVKSPYGPIPVRRLIASQGARVERITYWIRVGSRVTGTGLSRKLEQLSYGLTGKLPDGLLFRVSTIEGDKLTAYKIQDEFIYSLLSVVSEEAQQSLIGWGA